MDNLQAEEPPGGDFWDYVMQDSERVFDDFIRSRKGRGKDYVHDIGLCFLDKLAEVEHFKDCFFETADESLGWMRSSEVEHNLTGKIPHRTTLFRLLNDLVDAGILQKRVVVEKYSRSSKEKKKSNTYYRLLLHEPTVPIFQVMNHEELLEAAIKYYNGFQKFGKLYLGAREFFESDGLKKEEIDDFLIECLEPRKIYEDDGFDESIRSDLEQRLEYPWIK